LVGHHHRLINITPGLSFLPSGSYGQDRQTLYRAFSAAIKLCGNIAAEVSAVIHNPPPIISDDAFALPAVSRLRNREGDGDLDFKIEGYYDDRATFRQLFLARCEDGTKILVKFSTTYSLELHEYCLERGHAPKILAYEILPGGWHAIAIEYLEGAVPLNNPDLKQPMMEFVSDLQREGFVHGDLRPPNILCRGLDFWIVDFDWGGRVGNARYPTLNLNPLLTEGRTSNNLLIGPDDDIRVLEVTFKSLA
jgi:hypothetical protein